MKILTVCQYYYPEQFRINDICESLVKSGHEVTVLTGLPNYPLGIIPREYKFFRKRKENINGVSVIRCFEIGLRGGRIKIALNYISYMLSASFRVLFLKNKFDIVFIYQLSPVIMAIPGILFSKLHLIKTFLYCLDIWPESIKTMNFSETGFMYKLIHKVSKWIYRKCDYIGVSTKYFINYLSEKNKVSVNKIAFIPQHAEDIYLNVSEKKENMNRIDFLFAGNIGRVQNVECILKAVSKIRTKKEFIVNFVGDGSFEDEAKLISKKLGIDEKVIFHGRHSLDRVCDFYTNSDALLLTLKGDSPLGLTIPGKLQGYIASGKPILGSISGLANDLIREANCGEYVEADDCEGLAILMEDFINNPLRYKIYGENGRKYFINNFTLDIFIERIETKLYELLKEI